MHHTVAQKKRKNNCWLQRPTLPPPLNLFWDDPLSLPPSRPCCPLLPPPPPSRPVLIFVQSLASSSQRRLQLPARLFLETELITASPFRISSTSKKSFTGFLAVTQISKSAFVSVIDRDVKGAGGRGAGGIGSRERQGVWV